MKGIVTTALVTALLFLSCGGVMAKEKKQPVPPAPLPKQISSAETVFLVKGQGSDPYIKGGSDLAFDTFYAEIKNWGKYKIVDSPEAAELIFELSYSSQQVGTQVWSANNTYTGTTQVFSSPDMDPRVNLRIYDGKTGFVLWSAAEARDLARRKKNRERNLRNAVREMVSNLRMRVEVKAE